jgi:hypothetical protein
MRIYSTDAKGREFRELPSADRSETMLQLSFKAKPPKIEISRASYRDDDRRRCDDTRWKHGHGYSVKGSERLHLRIPTRKFLNNLFMNKSALSVTD